jgi:son of sevenless-like protein
VAIRADKALMDMFYQGDVLLYSEEQGSYLRNRTAQTYDEVVKDLILCEKSYLRDLHMITKVSKL